MNTCSKLYCFVRRGRPPFRLAPSPAHLPLLGRSEDVDVGLAPPFAQPPSPTVSGGSSRRRAPPGHLLLLLTAHCEPEPEPLLLWRATMACRFRRSVLVITASPHTDGHGKSRGRERSEVGLGKRAAQRRLRGLGRVSPRS
jgi:hypothetical protein